MTVIAERRARTEQVRSWHSSWSGPEHGAAAAGHASARSRHRMAPHASARPGGAPLDRRRLLLPAGLNSPPGPRRGVAAASAKEKEQAARQGEPEGAAYVAALEAELSAARREAHQEKSLRLDVEYQRLQLQRRLVSAELAAGGGDDAASRLTTDGAAPVLVPPASAASSGGSRCPSCQCCGQCGALSSAGGTGAGGEIVPGSAARPSQQQQHRRAPSTALSSASSYLSAQAREALLDKSAHNAEQFQELQRLRGAVERLEGEAATASAAGEEADKAHRATLKAHAALQHESRERQGELERERMHVAELQEHVHKLSIALRIEAQAKQQLERKLVDGEARFSRLRDKALLYRERAREGDAALAHMKAEIDMLSGQLQLLDDRYTDVRFKLELERHSKNEEAGLWKKVALQEKLAKMQQDKAQGGPASRAARGRRADHDELLDDDDDDDDGDADESGASEHKQPAGGKLKALPTVRTGTH